MEIIAAWIKSRSDMAASERGAEEEDQT